VRRFVIVGNKARGGFSLDDLPGTSGRLDLLLRSARAALLVSHGVRRDTIVYLVLGGDPAGPRTLRIDGPTAKFLRPDERAFAVIAQKALASSTGFGDPTRGVSVAAGGLDLALADAGPGALYVLDEAAPRDLREGTIDPDPIFVLGDHLGLDPATRARVGGAALRIGPVSVHADDAVAVVVNELDRQGR